MMEMGDQNVQKFSGSGPVKQWMERNLPEAADISSLPADTDHRADIPFHAAARGVEDPGDLRVQQLTDAQQIVFIFQT